MGATFRTRPRSVPSLAAETMIPDEDPDRSMQSIQRTLTAIAVPAGLAASHPTLRDHVQTVTLVSGTNWIANRLGRAPRFVYVTPIGTGITAWYWKMQSGDLDLQRIDLEVTGGAAAIVRME